MIGVKLKNSCNSMDHLGIKKWHESEIEKQLQANHKKQQNKRIKKLKNKNITLKKGKKTNRTWMNILNLF